MRYLREAFLAKWNVPQLGAIPFNIVGLAAFAVLGFGEPAFWLLGAGAEAAFLFALATNKRFQKYVDSKGLIEEGAESRRASLVQRLSGKQKARLESLEAKCKQVLQVYQDQQVNEFAATSNAEALKKLEWVFLKLLVAQHHLNEVGRSSTQESLRGDIASLEKELQRPNLSRTLRESKQGMLKIVRQRLANWDRRDAANAEIESDLGRVEAQVELALENATMEGQAELISADVELTSRLLSAASFGDLSGTVDEVDREFFPSETTSSNENSRKETEG